MTKSLNPVIPKSPLPIRLDWMTRLDFEGVLAIEAESFRFPWDVENFVHVLHDPTCIGIVARIGGGTAGFAVVDYRPQYLQILDLAVDGDCRRRGVGSAILADLARRCRKTRRRRIIANVSEASFAAQQFFAGNGFRAVEVVRDAFEGRAPDGRLVCVEDAYRFVLSLDKTIAHLQNGK